MKVKSIDLKEEAQQKQPAGEENKEKIEEVSLVIDDLQISKGDFVAIVGKYSSGKTSLLNAILGEMKKKNGTIQLKGSFSYISQTVLDYFF